MKNLFNSIEEFISGFFLCITVLVVVVNVFLRKVFGYGLFWAEEVPTACFIWSVFVGASAAYKRHMHIGIDMVLQKLPPLLQQNMAIFINAIMLMLNSYIALLSYQLMQASSTKTTPVLEISYSWLVGGIFVGFALMAITSAVFLGQNFVKLWISLPIKGRIGLGIFYGLLVAGFAYLAFDAATQKAVLAFLNGFTTKGMYLWPAFLLMILYFLGVPIAFALLAATLAFFALIDTGMPTDLIIQDFVKKSSPFPLLAVPFFIMAGEVMNYSGISANLMKMADVLTGHLRGGLAQVNVVLSTLMGGISGSANADAAMQSKILVPEMEKRGYGKAFSTAITAASSSISPVIPPGINLIIYALIANVSVGRIFIAGYTPGLLMALSLMVAVAIISKKRGYKPVREKMSSMDEILIQLVKSIPALLIPFGIILGLRFGWFTPTEGGAIAVAFCTFVGLVLYRQLKFKHFAEIIKNTLYSTSIVVLIIVAASVFGSYMSWEGIPRKITTMLTGISENKYAMLAVINVLLLVLGMFLEGGALLIIIAPLLVPVVLQMQIDPIHFGIILIVNIMIGGITPPFGSMMFTTCSITKAPIGAFVKEIMPFIFALIMVLIVITYIPQVVMFLPNWLFPPAG